MPTASPTANFNIGGIFDEKNKALEFKTLIGAEFLCRELCAPHHVHLFVETDHISGSAVVAQRLVGAPGEGDVAGSFIELSVFQQRSGIGGGKSHGDFFCYFFRHKVADFGGKGVFVGAGSAYSVVVGKSAETGGDSFAVAAQVVGDGARQGFPAFDIGCEHPVAGNTSLGESFPRGFGFEEVS